MRRLGRGRRAPHRELLPPGPEEPGRAGRPPWMKVARRRVAHCLSMGSRRHPLHCKNCGARFSDERAELGYDYCSRAECVEACFEPLDVVAVAVNKASDQYVLRRDLDL